MIKSKHYTKVVKKARHFSLKKPFLIFSSFIFLSLILLGALYFFFLKDLPSPTGLSATTASYSTHIYDRHGKLLYTLYSDRNQTFVPLSKLPKQLQQATIAIEDKDFYRHGAVDLRGIARAAYSIYAKKQLQGGSTLTQQLIKSSLLTPERTFTRKIKEVVLAFAAEVMYSKDKILEMYLNQVPYGGTAYGAEAASQTYFGKHVEDLTLAESAYLAGLPQEPSTFSPHGSHPELGKKRQEEVIRKMYDQSFITKQQRDKAIAQQLHFEKITNPIKAPHFVFYVKDLLSKKYGPEIVERGGLKVYTSLDLDVQDFAQQTVAKEIAGLEANHVGNGGALITQPGTGEILAMVGSKDYFDPKHGNVNTTIALLQPGSSIKPINYAVGLTKGYSAATPFIDQPICFPDPSGKPYCPHNYDNRFHGVVSMRTALGNSFNIPAVQMLKMNTIESMLATASAMGISTFNDPRSYGLSLTLGGGEVTMVDMTTAYGVFANQGYRIDPHPILKIIDRNGKTIEEYTPPKSPIFGKKVLSSEVAFIISDILADNNARIQAFGPSSELKINKQHVSVKTGTTNDYRDNWTIGYTPSYLVAVWVGNNDHTPMYGVQSGVTGAAPIWHNLMEHLLNGKKPEIPQKPPNVIGKHMCVGQFSSSTESAGCPFEYFIKGVPEKTLRMTKEKVWVDKTTNDLGKQGQTDNVELREETMMVDSLGNKYCVTCAHPTPVPPAKP
jgi:1A family penicillin-binding protein